jgi:regulation of enolase protein 1 (concanavalin A-like superfamily)
VPIYNFQSGSIPDNFFWFNQPHTFHMKNGLTVLTDLKTDFWQRTHYGFRPDNGHALLTSLDSDFSLKTRTEFTPKTLYDQCGLYVRIDSQNWIKCSIELEKDGISRLGSVVTNLGYSDWATQDISSDIRAISYRLSRRAKDFLIEFSYNEKQWSQMRVTHLHELEKTIDAGIYACSPLGEKFEARFNYLQIDKNRWFPETTV